MARYFHDMTSIEAMIKIFKIFDLWNNKLVQMSWFSGRLSDSLRLILTFGELSSQICESQWSLIYRHAETTLGPF